MMTRNLHVVAAALTSAIALLCLPARAQEPPHTDTPDRRVHRERSALLAAAATALDADRLLEFEQAVADLQDSLRLEPAYAATIFEHLRLEDRFTSAVPHVRLEAELEALAEPLLVGAAGAGHGAEALADIEPGDAVRLAFRSRLQPLADQNLLVCEPLFRLPLTDAERRWLEEYARVWRWMFVRGTQSRFASDTNPPPLHDKPMLLASAIVEDALIAPLAQIRESELRSRADDIEHALDRLEPRHVTIGEFRAAVVHALRAAGALESTIRLVEEIAAAAQPDTARFLLTQENTALFASLASEYIPHMQDADESDDRDWAATFLWRAWSCSRILPPADTAASVCFRQLEMRAFDALLLDIASTAIGHDRLPIEAKLAVAAAVESAKARLKTWLTDPTLPPLALQADAGNLITGLDNALLMSRESIERLSGEWALARDSHAARSVTLGVPEWFELHPRQGIAARAVITVWIPVGEALKWACRRTTNEWTSDQRFEPFANSGHHEFHMTSDGDLRLTLSITD